MSIIELEFNSFLERVVLLIPEYANEDGKLQSFKDRQMTRGRSAGITELDSKVISIYISKYRFNEYLAGCLNSCFQV